MSNFAATLALLATATSAAPAVTTPMWVRDAVFYQIFPERFANGDPKNDPKGSMPWGSEPEVNNFMGGDLDGVRQRLPYLKALGVNAIYFNPIFTATTNHKYNATDYMHVDPAFGGDAAFRRFLKAAHQQGIKVVLDGVFNHTGTSHAFFQDAVKRGAKSPYWNWYHFDGYPVVMSPKPNYEAWWGFAELPKLQVAKNPAVANYIYQVEEHWLREGIDGWRLDVPNEIDSDAFWQGFRQRAKAINPDAYIVGEIWDPAQRWLKGDQFDAVMNYQWRNAMLKFFATHEIDAATFDANQRALAEQYDPAITAVMFNLLDSHDTVRFLTDAGGDVNRLKLAATYQMTTGGAPVIYYGDEVGMQGGKDPDDRRCFDWNSHHFNMDVMKTYVELIALRHAHPALRTGTTATRFAKGNMLAYTRTQGADKWLIALNTGPSIERVDLDLTGWVPEGTKLENQVGAGTALVKNGHASLKLDPQTAYVFQPATH
jgi:glycosidase